MCTQLRGELDAARSELDRVRRDDESKAFRLRTLEEEIDKLRAQVRAQDTPPDNTTIQQSTGQ